MVGLFEKVSNFIRGLGRTIEGITDEINTISEPQNQEFTRKFVAGLVYCGGKKRSIFALTYEANDMDRESELLNAIEEQNEVCSDIRDYHGYSEEEGFRDGSPIFPEIEVGVE